MMNVGNPIDEKPEMWGGKLAQEAMSAKEKILAEKKEREQACAKRVLEVFTEYQCKLDVKMVLSPNKNPEVISSIVSL